MVLFLFAKWDTQTVKLEVGVTGIVNRYREVAQLVRAGFLEVRFLLSLQYEKRNGLLLGNTNRSCQKTETEAF